MDDAVEALGDDRDALLVDVRQEHRELVAAEARHQVCFPQPARQRPGDRLERVVARLVAVRVVDPLEVVEVDHHQARHLAVALRARDLQVQVVLEQAAVAQAGERVVVGEVAQVLLELACARRCPGAARCSAAARRSRSRTSDIERIADDGLSGGVEVALLDLEGGDLAGQQPLALREVVVARPRGA